MNIEALIQLAKDIKTNFNCDCDPGEDAQGDDVDCDGACGGDGNKGLDGCWWCQANAALGDGAVTGGGTASLPYEDLPPGPMAAFPTCLCKGGIPGHGIGDDGCDAITGGTPGAEEAPSGVLLAIHDLATARLRNSPADPNVVHDLTEIARLAATPVAQRRPAMEVEISREMQVILWEEVNEYAAAVAAERGVPPLTSRRMEAVTKVHEAVVAAIEADRRGEP